MMQPQGQAEKYHRDSREQTYGMSGYFMSVHSHILIPVACQKENVGTNAAKINGICPNIEKTAFPKWFPHAAGCIKYES